MRHFRLKLSRMAVPVLLFIVTAFLILQNSVVYGAKEPFELGEFKAVNQIDTLLLESLQKQHLAPANLCSDAVFIRRVYLDVIGTLPDAPTVRRFLENPRTDKRTTLVNTLLKSDEFADYRALRWSDVLRVKAEFPINLWPNAVQAYHRWIRDALAENMPYDWFARELLTASGSNFRVPQVNFYRAIQGHEPATIASAAALTFMGSRYENWPAEQKEQMAAFFSRVAYKSTAEWKEEIVYLDPEPVKELKTVFPDGRKVTIRPTQDPRQVFADWLIDARNPWFAKCAVNRIWYWLMGRGLIHEPDDIRDDNKPVHPELLAYLQKEFVASGYDVKHIYRLILTSSTYQQSSIAKTEPSKAEKLFACYPVRQLDAEVLIDALCKLTGSTENYSSPIPEPFTFIPPQDRTIELADGSITSSFLVLFGRPSRDTGILSERSNEPTADQRRTLLNSTTIQSKIDRSWRIRSLIKNARRKHPLLINTVYLNVLSRYPTPDELYTAQEYYKTSKLNLNQATGDLVWALMNSKEFLYRH